MAQQGKANLKTIREFLETQKWNVKLYPVSHVYEMINPEGVSTLINVPKPSYEFYEEVTKSPSIQEFVNKYPFVPKDPAVKRVAAAKAPKEPELDEEGNPIESKKKRKHKWGRGELAAHRAAKKEAKEKAEKIESITNAMHEVTIKMMTLRGKGVEKDAKEMADLRKELHKLNDERVALGWKRPGNEVISAEDVKEFKKRREHKKKERAARKNQVMKRKTSSGPDEAADIDEEELTPEGGQ